MTHRPDEPAQRYRARETPRQAISDLLRGTGLGIREHADGLSISNARDPGRGRIHITYAAGDVSPALPAAALHQREDTP
jgi:hypothetical protein